MKAKFKRDRATSAHIQPTIIRLDEYHTASEGDLSGEPLKELQVKEQGGCGL